MSWLSRDATEIAYLVAAVCFILALKGLSSPKTARRGNLIGALGAVIVTGHAHSTLALGTGLTAVVLATLNMVGGFVVTDRMLQMFGRGRRPARREERADA